MTAADAPAMTADRFLATCDLAAQVRGRMVPAPAAGQAGSTSCGWVPANLALTAFGPIAAGSPFGSAGDLRLRPTGASALLPPAPGSTRPTEVVLADQVDLDGQPWECCPRHQLRLALDDLERDHGISVIASFEHEFVLHGLPPSPPFSLERLRAAEPLGTDLLTALADAGMEPESWLPEYGEDQYELTLAPAPAVTAADRAILFREVVRDTARQRGTRASFAPIQQAGGTGTGVHIHLSLLDGASRPVLYDPDRPGRLSVTGSRFAAGILAHARALAALTAPSPSSFLRLQPHRWSAGGIYLAERDREALVRICPTTATSRTAVAAQFNLEYRAADAAANPWLALAALVRAGTEGLNAGSALPEPVVHLERAGTPGDVPALPGSLREALSDLAGDPTVRSWFPADLLDCFHAVKASELAHVDGMDEDELVRAVALAY